MKTNKLKISKEDRLLYGIVTTLLITLTIVIAYPLVYIISSSFSSPNAVTKGKIILFPVEFGFEGYNAVFKHKSIMRAYTNTIFYTLAGTAINVAMTLMCAYPLSRKDFPLRRFFTILFMVPMFFGGGMIPTYILMVQIGFVDTIWAMIIPGAIATYNMIVTRTFMINSIPEALLEASQIDGCSDSQYFFRVLLPLSSAVIAVITLFYAVGHWNAYFNALLYLSNPDLMPLQIVLRNILIANQVNLAEIQDPAIIAGRMGMADLLKYSLIIVSSAPIIILYPFIQRYFIKGVMIGSIKG